MAREFRVYCPDILTEGVEEYVGVVLWDDRGPAFNVPVQFYINHREEGAPKTTSQRGHVNFLIPDDLAVGKHQISVQVVGSAVPDSYLTQEVEVKLAKVSPTAARTKEIGEEIALHKKEQELNKLLRPDVESPEIVEVYARTFMDGGAKKLRIFANAKEKKPIIGLKGNIEFSDGTAKEFKVEQVGFAVVTPPPFTGEIGFTVVAGTKAFRGRLVAP